MVDIGRAVACAHADGGLAGGIGRLHHAGAAGGQDQPCLRGGHQLLTAGQSGNRQAQNAAFGCSRRLRRLRHQLRRSAGAGDGLGMGRKDNAAACLQGDDGLVADRGGGIGAGDDGRNDPHGHADLPELLLRVFRQYPHGLHTPDGLPHPVGGKEVFRGLVPDVAEAGLLHRHLRQGFRLLRKGLPHGLHNCIQLLLGEACQDSLGGLSLFCQLPRLLPGL